MEEKEEKRPSLGNLVRKVTGSVDFSDVNKRMKLNKTQLIKKLTFQKMERTKSEMKLGMGELSKK